MKISIGMRIQPGPWGGGNRFALALADHLRTQGHTVCHDLAPDDLDIILLAEPDRRLRVSAYDHADILRYLLFVNRRALVVHRINNSSEARDDAQGSFNRFRIQANRIADHTVFVSQWVRRCYQTAGFATVRPNTVIPNGADARLWQPSAPDGKRPDDRLRIVTHHWSTHVNKGWDIYRQLDELLGDPPWNEWLQFTFVGQLPEGERLVNSRHVPALSGAELAEELRSHDLYLTASRFEAGPNHVLEAALCGLPLLYRDSGSMAEYCDGYGIAYTAETLENCLERMREQRSVWQGKMRNYPFTADRMCTAYEELFNRLCARRNELLAERRLGVQWSWLVKVLLNRLWNG
ncbi:MAG: glycosyltransferase family 4 protein [Magnetococcus sp. YQC-9]